MDAFLKKYLPNLTKARGSVYSMRFSSRDQVLFAKRLSFLVSASVPLLESMYVLKEQATSGRMVRLYDALITDVAAGQTLSSSLKKFTRAFGHFAVNIIRVGEMSGVLAQNLIYLADELKKRHELRRKIQGALIYPIIVSVATIGVAGILTVYIFPKIMPIFISLHVELPITTRALLWLSLFLQNNGLYVIGCIVAFCIGWGVALRALPLFKYWVDRTLLHIPITGSIARAYNMTTICRTLGLMLKSGIVLSEAVIIVGETMENTHYRKLLAQVALEVQTGKRLSTLLEKHKRYFPPMMTHLVAIGERTGNLSGSLMYLADLYDGELDDMTKNLSNSIEPILMVVMGLVVGLVAVSVIAPIYQVTQSLQR